MKIHDTLSSTLNCEFSSERKGRGTEITTLPEDKKEIVSVSEETEAPTVDPTVEKDFATVRNTLHGLIETGNTAIQDMHAIAQHDEQARSFEVLATLIKTVSETAEKLLDSHEKKSKIYGVGQGNKKIVSADHGVSIDKAVFVGTTADLLKQLKSKDE